MNLGQLLHGSRLTLINGAAKSTKLSFCLFALTEYLENNTLSIVSPENPKRMLSRLNISREQISNFSNLHELIKFHFLKSDWKSLKITYGLELLVKDIEHLFTQTDDKFVLFHGFQRFFDVPDRRLIEPTIEEIIELASKFDKKLIFTCDPEVDSGYYIAENLNTQADLILGLKEGHNATTKSLNIDFSLYPIEVFHYLFCLNEGTLTLTEKPSLLLDNPVDNPANTTVDSDSKEAAIKTVLLYSQDENIINLHQYLLTGNDNIQLEVCRNISQALSGLLLKPTVFIYHCNEVDGQNDLSETLQKNNLGTQLTFIINKKKMREEDRMKMSELYNCSQLFDLSFRITEYVLNMEENLNVRFYSRHKNSSVTPTICNDFKAINEYISVLRERRVMYCVHQLKGVTKPAEQIAKILRPGDAVYVDGLGAGWIVCVFSQKEDASAIAQKLKQVCSTCSLLASTNLLPSVTDIALEA